MDGAAGEGFTNAGAALVMSPALLTKYLDAAKEVANHLVLLPDGVRFSEPETYVSQAEPLDSPDIVHFNHGLAEIFNAVWDAGMEITSFDEHDSVPWNALGDAMEHVGGGEYRLVQRPERLPASYTLRARKR